VFLSNNLIDLYRHNLLEKDIRYYRDRIKGRQIWESVFYIAQQLEVELIQRYPDLKMVVGRK
jgi:hypothetical protein